MDDVAPESVIGWRAMRCSVLALFLAAGAAFAQAPSLPKGELLWANGAPGALGTEEVDKPTLYPYVVPAGRGTGTAVIVCPGGGYGGLSMDKEGDQIAKWLNSLGVTSFVLKYRLGPKYHHPVELGDAQRAIRTVRAKAAEYRVMPERIGIMGFSAGGHLASTAGTHFDAGNAGAADAIDRVSSRPDFLVLCYPVISFGTFAHQGSRRNLLGENPDPALVESLSNETQVTAETPPTFLFHTTTDATVPVENSVLFYSALRKAGVPAELHIYERGPHGVGLAQTDEALSSWPSRLAAWLRIHGLLNLASR
ncbi:MAG: alpha/beta hydrolase [Candidatus Solibacter sp.]|nr:alpha/beta hydrolase [Candidatus Solibacter sp.]